MPDIDAVLSALRRLALADPAVCRKLLSANHTPNPVDSFCSTAAELGYTLSPMDLINAGEQYYADMRRSTNGGGENSPLLKGEDDYFELFMAELSEIFARQV